MTNEKQITAENLTVSLLDLESCGEYELVSAPNYSMKFLKGSEYPVYVSIKESNPSSTMEMAVGLTVEQTKELIENLQNILQEANE